MILTSSNVCCRRVSNQRTRRHHSLWLINAVIPNHPSHFTRAHVVFLFSWVCRASASALPPADKQPGEQSLYSLPNRSFRSHPARSHIMGSLMSSSTPNNGADGGFSQINKTGVIVSLLCFEKSSMMVFTCKLSAISWTTVFRWNCLHDGFYNNLDSVYWKVISFK